MVPDLIWAPDFFGPREIWSSRNWGPKKFGPSMKMRHNDFHAVTKFLGDQISCGLLNEIGDHFNYSQELSCNRSAEGQNYRTCQNFLMSPQSVFSTQLWFCIYWPNIAGFSKSIGSSLIFKSTWEQFSSCLSKAEKILVLILLTRVTYFLNFILSFLKAVWIWIFCFVNCFWLFSKKNHTRFYPEFQNRRI